jgi:hypothetical protein
MSRMECFPHKLQTLSIRLSERRRSTVGRACHHCHLSQKPFARARWHDSRCPSSRHAACMPARRMHTPWHGRGTHCTGCSHILGSLSSCVASAITTPCLKAVHVEHHDGHVSGRRPCRRRHAACSSMYRLKHSTVDCVLLRRMREWVAGLASCIPQVQPPWGIPQVPPHSRTVLQLHMSRPSCVICSQAAKNRCKLACCSSAPGRV